MISNQMARVEMTSHQLPKMPRVLTANLPMARALERAETPKALMENQLTAKELLVRALSPRAARMPRDPKTPRVQRTLKDRRMPRAAKTAREWRNHNLRDGALLMALAHSD